MADHSPLPWRVMLDETFGGDKAVDGIAAADGVVIEDMIHPDDAEFICRAVNHHDALLAALKGVLAGFDAGVWCRNTDGDHDPAWAIKFVTHVKALADATKAVEDAEAHEEPATHAS